MHMFSRESVTVSVCSQRVAGKEAVEVLLAERAGVLPNSCWMFSGCPSLCDRKWDGCSMLHVVVEQSFFVHIYETRETMITHHDCWNSVCLHRMSSARCGMHGTGCSCKTLRFRFCPTYNRVPDERTKRPPRSRFKTSTTIPRRIYMSSGVL